MSAVDPISYLEGQWSFERRIEDRCGGPDARATGTATFVRRADGLLWLESGELQIGDLVTAATRELRVVRDDRTGYEWMVTFEDGRPFHRLDLGESLCEVRHSCRDDLYEGRIETGQPDSFRTIWKVRGPFKDQLIETVYRRVTGP